MVSVASGHFLHTKRSTVVFLGMNSEGVTSQAP